MISLNGLSCEKVDWEAVAPLAGKFNCSEFWKGRSGEEDGVGSGEGSES